MSSELTPCTLGDILTLQRGMDLPKNDRAMAGKYPVIASTGVVGYHDKFQAKGPGVVIGRSGSIGGGQFIKGDFWPLNTTLWVKDFKGNNPRFCYYLLKSIDFSRFNVGTGVPTLNRNHIHPMAVVKPSPALQEKIANLLGCIDDLISLLQSQNKALESIARTLFRSWFVDFDPVHAKAAGKEPDAMSAELAELFPSEFEVYESSQIPKGWCIGRIGDIGLNPRVQGKLGEMPSTTPYVGLEHIPRRALSITDWGSAAKVESGKFWFEPADILFGKLRPYFHKVGLANTQGVCSTDILVIRPRESIWHAFLTLHLSSPAFIENATQLSDGARMPRTNWSDTAAYKFALPPKELARQLNDKVQPMFSLMRANIETIRLLAKLRDHLLPQLISGKLSLEDAKTSVAEITSNLTKELA